MSSSICPSCGAQAGKTDAACAICGWQFSGSLPVIASRAVVGGRSPTIAHGINRPLWISREACQLAIIVRDKSGSMIGAKARDASNASLDLVKTLAEPSGKDGFYVAAIDFNSNAEVVDHPTKATELIGRMKELAPRGSDGATNITDGLAKAVDIVGTFNPQEGRKALRAVVVLFSDGCHNHGSPPDTVAEALKAQADLVCVAFGEDADEAGLRKWASPNLFTRCANGGELRKFFAAVGATMQATRARGINATQALAHLQVR